MQTFEQVYKEKLKKQLEQFLDNPIIVSSDISYDPLIEDANAIVAVIKTGIGQASSRNDYDLIQTTFTVNFILDANNTQLLLGALTSLIWNYNGKWDTLTLNVWNVLIDKLQEKPYIFKPVFTTPVPVGGINKVKSATKTIDAVNVMFNISVGYSSNADLKPDDFTLIIDDVPFPIRAVRYDMTSAPAYEPINDLGEQFSTQELFSENIVFTFRLLKSLPGVDALQDILSDEFFGNDFLSRKELKLKRGNKEVGVQLTSLQEIYEAGTKIMLLTLSR